MPSQHQQRIYSYLIYIYLFISVFRVYIWNFSLVCFSFSLACTLFLSLFLFHFRHRKQIWLSQHDEFEFWVTTTMGTAKDHQFFINRPSLILLSLLLLCYEHFHELFVGRKFCVICVSVRIGSSLSSSSCLLFYSPRPAEHVSPSTVSFIEKILNKKQQWQLISIHVYEYIVIFHRMSLIKAHLSHSTPLCPSLFPLL